MTDNLSFQPFLWVLHEAQGNHLPEGLAVFLHHVLVSDAGLQGGGVVLQRQHQDLEPQEQLVRLSEVRPGLAARRSGASPSSGGICDRVRPPLPTQWP